MYYFRRSDINLRNEWSNYTNWAYNNIIPQPVTFADPNGDWTVCNQGNLGPNTNPIDNTVNSIFITGDYFVGNQRNILLSMGILLDGKYRENVLDEGVYNYVEKYVRTSGNAKDGLYCYNFELYTDPFDYQPSGAMNMSKFNDIQYEFQTYVPPLDPSASFYNICDPDGIVIGVNKPTWMIYDYNYDLTIHEERYNIITFIGGNCGLMYAR